MICFYSGLINFSPKYFSESGGGEIFINGCRKTLNKWLRTNLTNRNIMDKFQNLFLSYINDLPWKANHSDVITLVLLKF